MPKPALLPRWATNETNNTEPSSGQKDTGWTTNQDAVSSYFNWLLYTIYLWIAYLDANIWDGDLTVDGNLTVTGTTTSTGLITGTAGITAAVNSNVTVSGTGSYRHGDHLLAQRFYFSEAIVTAGAVNINGGNPGLIQAVSSTAFHPIIGLDSTKRIKSVTVHLSTTPGANVDYQLALVGAGGFQVPGTWDSPASSGTISYTYTPSVPLALDTASNSGYHVTPWLKVTTPGGTTAELATMVVTYDCVSAP